MSERAKASVLRDVAMTAQSRALPLRRAAPEPKPMAARPVPAFPASSVASQVTPPAREEAHARALAASQSAPPPCPPELRQPMLAAVEVFTERIPEMIAVIRLMQKAVPVRGD